MANYHLTERDRAVVAETIRLVKQWFPQLTGNPQAAPQRNTWSRVVLTPSGGIPAVDDVTPGDADCNLAWVESGGDIEELTNPDPITVYNHGPKIPGDTYILAVRDPWSRWWAVPGSLKTNAILKTGVGGIAVATDWDTPTGATCTMYRFDGTEFVVYSPSITETVYNMNADYAVEGDTYIQAVLIDGAWFASWEPCVIP